MSDSNFSLSCYILPIVGLIFYLFLSLPPVLDVFNSWIPDYYYCTSVKGLLLLMVLYLTCQIVNIFTNSNDSPCMDINDTTSQLQDDNQDFSLPI